MSNPHSRSISVPETPAASFDRGTFLLMSNKTGNHKFYHLHIVEGNKQQMMTHYGSKRRKGYVDVSDVKRDSLFMCCNEAMLDLGSLGEWDSAKFKNGTHLVCCKCGTTSEHSPLAALVLASLQEE